MGRRKGSSYKSQLLILLFLRDFGSLYGQKIVKKTGLHRTVVWRNLNVLLSRRIIEKRKIGRRTYYEPCINPKVLEWIISILYEGGLEKIRREFFRSIKKPFRSYTDILKVLKKAKKYENEIIGLGSKGTTPYIEALPFAIELARIKKDRQNVGLASSIKLSETEKKRIRESIKYPKSPQIKEVKLPSGLTVIIRRMTLIEWLDIIKKLIQKNNKENNFEEQNFIEAVRLLS